MLESSKFDHYLFDLKKIILDGVSYFIVWQGLNTEYEYSNSMIGQRTNFWWQYRGFFAPSRKALSVSALIQLSKAFDRDTRDISVSNLLKLILENRKELAPYATRGDLKSIFIRIDNNTELIERLRQYRNKRLAHFEADLNYNVELPPKEVQTLIDETKAIYNFMKYSHEGKYDDFNDIMKDVYLHTKEVIGIMKQTVITTG